MSGSELSLLPVSSRITSLYEHSARGSRGEDYFFQQIASDFSSRDTCPTKTQHLHSQQHAKRCKETLRPACHRGKTVSVAGIAGSDRKQVKWGKERGRHVHRSGNSYMRQTPGENGRRDEFPSHGKRCRPQAYGTGTNKRKKITALIWRRRPQKRRETGSTT